LGKSIKAEDLDALNNNCSSSVETTREGVKGAADGNDKIIKVAFAISYISFENFKVNVTRLNRELFIIYKSEQASS